MLSRFHLIPGRHGQTDRQTEMWTDGQTDLLYQYRASACSRAIKRLHSRYCTVGANYRQTRSIALVVTLWTCYGAL